MKFICIKSLLWYKFLKFIFWFLCRNSYGLCEVLKVPNLLPLHYKLFSVSVVSGVMCSGRYDAHFIMFFFVDIKIYGLKLNISVSNITLVLFFNLKFRYLSPLSAVPLVALAGFGLYELGFPGVNLSYCLHLKFSSFFIYENPCVILDVQLNNNVGC